MRALVTGGAGFIGRHLCRALGERGHDVASLDVQPLEMPGVTHGVGDIRDTALLDELLPGVEVVHHLASVHLQVRATEEEFQAVNVRATRDLVTACARHGVRRLVHASSVGVFGHVEDPPADEAAPKRPGSLYERSKLAGEVAALEAAEARGQDVIVLRPAWVYGPGCPRTAKLLRAIASGRFLYVGRGENLRHPVFVDDVVDAFARAAEAPAECAGRVYIIGGPSPIRLRELVTECALALGVPPPRRALPRPLAVALGLGLEIACGAFRREPPFSRRSIAFFENDNAFDTSAAARDLGFVPRTTLAEGLAATLEERREAAA
ncbi:MAG TPA: NAD-dependent epimerase/dehydratase family protein [Longimicrobiales bacterium]|nr:NAD-dependent epimerase/dehydratase family protein [Longimicrobiales bacterium]